MNGNLFSERLRLARMRCGLGQKQLGEMIGLIKTAISAYETGSKVPKLATVCLLADALDTSIDYLVGRTDGEESAPGKPSQQKTIALKSGGRLTLSAEIDTLSIDSKDALAPLSKDWAFIYDMVDQLDAYAAGTEHSIRREMFAQRQAEAGENAQI